ncbi:unnamed protein product [Phaedon cochleariae]|uniref:Hairy n=1 Tax=Phaedon cochleariae TaxID=80249 RepID=A0A9P0GRD0_PHACE|nr:unnamed protein product [Phaedon cochleariae]
MVTMNSVVTSTSMMQASSISPTPSGHGEAPSRRTNENRRSNKPIMEKRRRARINNCLNELKTLILDAMKKDPARHSKLEKADILEMTVKHLQNLQRQQIAMSAAADPTVLNKFRAGFSDCATEVGRFPGLDPIVKRRLLQHLSNCLNQGSKPQEVPQVQVHILPNSHKTEQQVPHTGGIILSNGNGTGVQLVPTRLPNGDIALVLPSSGQLQGQPQTSPVPLLVPIVPERTPSVVSGTSGSSGYSPSHSPEPMDTMYSEPKPLSLVVRKNVEESDEKPWRPW